MKRTAIKMGHRRCLRLSRRDLLGFGALAGLSACGESQLARTVIDAYKLTVSGQPDAPISRESVSNIPYASVAAKIGKGPRSLLILWRQERRRLHWLSADNVAIVTLAGRVVATAGLPEEMRSTTGLGVDPLVSGLHKIERASFSREVHFERDGPVVSVLDSLFERVGERRIVIEDVEFETILFYETTNDRVQNWQFVNSYWVDPFDGFVWKSRQHIARTFPPIEIEVLKPFA